MTRPTRIEIPGALYHVFARGNQRRQVFRDQADYEVYLARLDRYQDRYAFILYAYVLMPNHVHLLLEPDKAPLSKIMQGIQQSYAAYFNRAHATVGHVFQGRYKAILCDRDRYLLALVRYLHLNPVRARLVRVSKEWRWSSHRDYLGEERKPRVATQLILRQFHPQRSLAIRRYLEFLQQPGAADHHPEYYQALEQQFLGDERFVEEMERRIQRKASPGAIAVSFGEVCQVVARAFDMTVEEIRAPGRERQAAVARAVAAHVAQLVGGIRLVEAAQAFGRDPVTISLGVQALRKRLQRDTQLAGRFERVIAFLRRGRAKKYKIINV